MKPRMGRAPNLQAALSAVSLKVRRALEASHEALRLAGVPHALIGGLAVGAHGYVRATRDVDWLVGDEAYRFVGKLVVMREGVPYEYDGVKIDYLSPAAEGEKAVLSKGAAISIAPVEHLVRQKLGAGRAKDQADVIELCKRGADERSILAYLRSAAPHLIPEFDRLASRARKEAP